MYQVQFSFDLPNQTPIWEQRAWHQFEKLVVEGAISFRSDCWHSGAGFGVRDLCFEFLTENDAENFCAYVNGNDSIAEKWESFTREELFFKVDTIEPDALDAGEIIEKAREYAETLPRPKLVEVLDAYIDEEMLQAIATLSDGDAASFLLDGWEENERDKNCVFEALAWHDSMVNATR